MNARYYNPENGNFLSLDAYPGDLKEPNSQNGVYIIYGATYRSGKIKEVARDFSGPYEVRSK
ncbi:hypothetical protein ACFCVU_27525 [Peribacillus butanolivorans]|uniref:hypothetical protein n=1 Tax=Peribacillus butanolivorans TaxID=421767 RepID=UPI0035DB6F58